MTVTARVQITIEFPADGAWEPRVQADQVSQQAAESAVNKLTKLLGGSGARIIGFPKVTMILAELDEVRR